MQLVIAAVIWQKQLVIAAIATLKEWFFLAVCDNMQLVIAAITSAVRQIMSRPGFGIKYKWKNPAGRIIKNAPGR